MVLPSIVMGRWYIVAERGSFQVSVFSISKQRITSFGSKDSGPENTIRPAGIASDDKDNVFVSIL